MNIEINSSATFEKNVRKKKQDRTSFFLTFVFSKISCFCELFKPFLVYLIKRSLSVSAIFLFLSLLVRINHLIAFPLDSKPRKKSRENKDISVACQTNTSGLRCSWWLAGKSSSFDSLSFLDGSSQILNQSAKQGAIISISCSLFMLIVSYLLSQDVGIKIDTQKVDCISLHLRVGTRVCLHSHESFFRTSRLWNPFGSMLCSQLFKSLNALSIVIYCLFSSSCVLVALLPWLVKISLLSSLAPHATT